MAVVSYTHATIKFGDVVLEVDGGGVEIERFERVVVRDNSCHTCGALDVGYSDGSGAYESCFELAHACERAVGRKRCMCGHRQLDHTHTGGSGLGFCLLCMFTGDECDRYRASVRRNEEAE